MSQTHYLMVMPSWRLRWGCGYQGTSGPQGGTRTLTVINATACGMQRRQKYSHSGSPPLLGAVLQRGNMGWLRTAVRGPLITPFTYARSCSYRPFPGFPLGMAEINTRVDRAGRCFQPHNLGNAKTNLRSLIEAFLHHNPGQEPFSLVMSAEIHCSNASLHLIQCWLKLGWAQNQTKTASHRSGDDINQLAESAVRQNTPQTQPAPIPAPQTGLTHWCT